MSLIKRDQPRLWDPFKELEDMSTRLNRFFGRSMLSGQEALTGFDWAPSINVSETPESYLVKAEVPGVKKEDLKVELDNGVLTITGERKHEQQHKDEKFHRVETSYGSFMRSFNVPENARPEGIEATYKDGMLSVRIAKAKDAPKAQAKRIAIS
jgi:HSP20 family protein